MMAQLMLICPGSAAPWLLNGRGQWALPSHDTSPRGFPRKRRLPSMVAGKSQTNRIPGSNFGKSQQKAWNETPQAESTPRGSAYS